MIEKVRMVPEEPGGNCGILYSPIWVGLSSALGGWTEEQKEGEREH